MESCQRMQVWISLRLDGMLEPEEERELEEHLAVCSECRSVAQELEAIHAVFPQVEDLEAPEGFAQGVMERIARQETTPKVVPLFRRPQVRALAGLAACAVLCIGLYQGGLLSLTPKTLTVDAASSVAQSGKMADVEEQAVESDVSGEEQDQTTNRAISEPEAADATDNPDLDVVPYVQADGVSPSASGDKAGELTPPSENGLSPQIGESSAYQGQLSVQPSQFETAANGTARVVAGQEVAAILTLDKLPDGWDQTQDGAVEWLTDETGHTCCILTWNALEKVESLAREEGINASLEGSAEGEQLCALVVLEES